MTTPSAPGEIGSFVIGFSQIGVQDSGPIYPPQPGAGSNAIGLFQQGVSPIGDIAAFNVWDTVQSEYANSFALMQLILNFNIYADQTENFSNFFDNIWNLDTANGVGLDIWGRIVGVNRQVSVATGAFFGFEEGAGQPFGQGVFYAGVGLTSYYTMADQAYRNLIIAKALANITDGSIKSINAILRTMFPYRGNCYVTDGPQIAPYFGFAESINAVGFDQAAFFNGEAIPTMVIQYVFDFPLTAVEIAIVEGSGVLPKPAGVLATYLIL